MPQATRCTVAFPSAFDQLPLSVKTRASGVSIVFFLSLAAPAMSVLALLVGALIALGSESLAVARQHPGAALQSLAGLALCTALFVLPALRVVRSLLHRQSIRIDLDGVRVAERHFWRQRGWTAPLADFRGLSHVVRTTISGQRHELVLLPRRQGRPLLLLAAENIAEETVAGLATLLRLRAIPASELRRPRRGQARFAVPALRSAAQASV
jgi:hypothetical protein